MVFPHGCNYKNNGRPHRTIDLQKLNVQCSRETHHCQSPFQLACQIPPNTKNTILDAVDGFHAIELHEAHCKLTTFITEWGRYCCCCLPQECLATADVYTKRYDNIIKDVPNKVKCVDDTLLCDHGIEAVFNHNLDYLKLRIRINFNFMRIQLNLPVLKLHPLVFSHMTIF